MGAAMDALSAQSHIHGARSPHRLQANCSAPQSLHLPYSSRSVQGQLCGGGRPAQDMAATRLAAASVSVALHVQRRLAPQSIAQAHAAQRGGSC